MNVSASIAEGKSESHTVFSLRRATIMQRVLDIASTVVTHLDVVGRVPARIIHEVRRESVETRSEMGTRSREVLRHTRAVCRRTERRDCLS
jgi:hypothetical protein